MPHAEMTYPEGQDVSALFCIPSYWCEECRCLTPFRGRCAPCAAARMALGQAGPGMVISVAVHASLLINATLHRVNQGRHAVNLREMVSALAERVPDDRVALKRMEGSSVPYLPWYEAAALADERLGGRWGSEVVREWAGEVMRGSKDGGYSAVGMQHCIVRVTLYPEDGAPVSREAVGVDDEPNGQRGTAMERATGAGLRRAFAQFGLGLHLYQEARARRDGGGDGGGRSYGGGSGSGSANYKTDFGREIADIWKITDVKQLVLARVQGGQPIGDDEIADIKTKMISALGQAKKSFILDVVAEIGGIVDLKDDAVRAAYTAAKSRIDSQAG